MIASQPGPQRCQTDAVHVAPDGQALILQYNCKTTLFARLFDLAAATTAPTTLPQGYFMGWSPDGHNLAYVLMPDTNIPFIVGELWLADIKTGAPHTYLAGVDAGQGYAPVWAPDSSSLTFVHRENPEDVRANIEPLALHSNLRQVEISSGAVVTLTHFVDSLVTEPVWSPTGEQLAFTANDAIWLWAPGVEPVQVSPAGSHRHAAWLSIE